MIIIIKGVGEDMGGDGYAYGFNGGDGFMVYIYLQIHWVVYIKYV